MSHGQLMTAANLCREGVKWRKNACYIHFVVESYWSELGLVSGSNRQWITV